MTDNPDGYVMVADTQSFGAGGRDAWVVKLDNSGVVEWEKTYGGSGLEMPQSIKIADDGGYVIGARTESFGAGKNDFWVFKVDANGDLLWQYTYGCVQTDTLQDLAVTQDHGYIMTGWTLSFGVDSYDAWVVKLTDAGVIDWQKAYTITYEYDDYEFHGDEWAYAVVPTVDGGYAISGDSDDWGHDRNGDVWIFKIDEFGGLGCNIETDTDAVPDNSAQITVSTETNTYDTSDTSAVVGTTDSIIYTTTPDVFTQCGP